MRSFGATRLLAAALLLLLGIAFDRPIWAQEKKDDPDEENQAKKGDDDKGKETCNPPEFSFTWQGYDLVKLTARADPAQAFIIKLNYLEEPKKGWDSAAFKELRLLPARATGPQKACADHQSEGDGLAEGVKFCLNATEEGSTAALFMDRQALLQAGGLVGLTYEALPGEINDVCLARQRGPEDPVRKALDKHSLSFDIGSVFNLQGDGSWEANMEAATVARLQWYDWLQTGFSVRYSSLGAVDEPEEGDPEDPEDPEDPGEPEEEEEFNPFESGGGLIETNVYVMFSLPDVPRLGLVTGWGLSSVPGGSDSKLELRERNFFGLRNTIQAFNAGRIGDTLENTSGYIQAGIADDDLWERVELEPASEDGTVPAEISDESKRYFFEGEFDIPRVGTEWFRINLRFFASVPRSGDGPSDLRISALASIDPRRWFPGFAQGN